MPRAWCLIRPAPHYRRGAFLDGLRAAGYDAMDVPPPVGGRKEGDLLVIWNRYGHFDSMAREFESSGGCVIVAENGYCGRDSQNRQHYALSAARHQRPLIEPRGERFGELGVSPAPWREKGEHVLVCAQRGFGIRPHCMEPRWPGATANALKLFTKRPVVIRPHPEDRSVPAKDKRGPLEEDLANCHAVVVWSSTAGVKALLAGVPVFQCGPDFIMEPATKQRLEDIESPFLGDRSAALERMAWGQWSVDEIQSGEPFVLVREGAAAWASATN